jgi:hypothetical protein
MLKNSSSAVAELRRCTVMTLKARMEVHELSGKHELRVGQKNDEGFPIHRQQPEIQPTPHVLSRQITSKITNLAEMLDIPVNIVLTATFH